MRRRSPNVLTPRRAARQRHALLVARTAASSARLYWESFKHIELQPPSRCRAASSIFPHEIFRLLAAAGPSPGSPTSAKLHELDRGGHFAAFEQPAILVEELRGFFRDLR